MFGTIWIFKEQEMNIKHNKKRNTAFLYEILVKEVAQATFNENHEYKEKVMNVLMEYFGRDTILARDYRCYKPLYETKKLQKEIADKLVLEAKSRRDKIDKKRLFNTQTRLINEINKNLSDDIWSNFVPEYRFLGTLYQYFYGDELPVKSKVILESQITRRLSSEAKREKDLIEPVDSITYNIFVEKFNNHYGKQLNERQKQTIKHYMFSIQDSGVSFKTFLNEEVKSLKKELKSTCEGENSICDLEINEKINKVGELLESYKNKPIKEEKMVPQILKIQELIEEMNSQENKNNDS